MSVELLNGAPIRKAHLRQTHPNLYRALMTYALISIALGVNFLLFTPTFQQFGIPKAVVGAGFLSHGLGQLLLLNLWRNLAVLRLSLVAGIGYMLFWGVGTTQTFFTGDTSLQLFVLYFGLAALQAPLLLEPYLNPVTANGKEEE